MSKLATLSTPSTPTWAEKTRALVLNGDFEVLFAHVQKFPKSFPLVNGEIQQILDTMADVVQQAQHHEAVQRGGGEEVDEKSNKKSPEPLSWETLVKSIVLSDSPTTAKLPTNITKVMLWGDALLQMGRQARDALLIATDNGANSEVRDNIMALHEGLIGLDRCLKSIRPSYPQERRDDALTAPIFDYVYFGNEQQAASAIDMMLTHSVLSTEPTIDISEEAKEWFDATYTRNVPTTTLSSEIIKYSSLDALVMKIMSENIQHEKVNGQPLQQIDQLARHIPVVAQSFEKILQNTSLIHEVFSKVRDQKNYMIERDMVKELMKLGVAQTNTPDGTYNPPQAPLEAFYDMLTSEHGLTKLGASSLEAKNTRLSIERVVGQRTKSETADSALLAQKESPKKII